MTEFCFVPTTSPRTARADELFLTVDSMCEAWSFDPLEPLKMVVKLSPEWAAHMESRSKKYWQAMRKALLLRHGINPDMVLQFVEISSLRALAEFGGKK